MVPFEKASVSRIKEALTRLLSEKNFTTRAQALAKANHEAGGLNRAVDLIEQALN
jgi:UDP:flavonoid glycosyltransferase YjiC (YdhE family)